MAHVITAQDLTNILATMPTTALIAMHNSIAEAEETHNDAYDILCEVLEVRRVDITTLTDYAHGRPQN